MTEAEMVRWHHQLDGHKFEQAPGVGDGQGGLHEAVPARKEWALRRVQCKPSGFD